MTTTTIIIICSLLLLAYVFDLSAARTKIPTVILLLLLGWLVKQIVVHLGLPVPHLQLILPMLGTVGLVLIVLEGALDLEIRRHKLTYIKKATWLALFPMLIFSVCVGAFLHYYTAIGLQSAIANAIPLGVISSAIAIPSVQALATAQREFIVYESSLSDIFGVLFFNFMIYNESIGMVALIFFTLELLLTLAITIVATGALVYLIQKIQHHVKFLPIILVIILVYSLAKLYHLPALVFILLFGLFLKNLEGIKKLLGLDGILATDGFMQEAHKFKELTIEVAFLVRALFFLLFGYLIQTEELLNLDSITWAVGMVAIIFLLRLVFLKVYRLPVLPLVFVAPRGLITVLLFLSIPISQNIVVINKSLVVQVVMLTALVMMIGLMITKNDKVA